MQSKDEIINHSKNDVTVIVRPRKRQHTPVPDGYALSWCRPTLEHFLNLTQREIVTWMALRVACVHQQRNKAKITPKAIAELLKLKSINNVSTYLTTLKEEGMIIELNEGEYLLKPKLILKDAKKHYPALIAEWRNLTMKQAHKEDSTCSS